jgi:predicted transcriptional regulator
MMISEFGEMRDVIVTPEMLKCYFLMTKTELLVHLFLLSVCDEDRHIKRNVRALARETQKWHADVYRAVMGLQVNKMLEDKHLQTKGSRYWRVYPVPRKRKDKSKNKDASTSLEDCPQWDLVDDETILLDTETKEKNNNVIAMAKPKRRIGIIEENADKIQKILP